MCPKSCTAEVAAIGIDTWRLLVAPADERTFKRASAIRVKRPLRVSDHVVGFDRTTRRLWIEGHPAGSRRLAKTSLLPGVANALEAALADHGLVVELRAARVSRLDVAVDVRFSAGGEGAAFLGAARTIQPPRLETVSYGHPVESVALAGRKGKPFFGRIYDAGLAHERAARRTLIRLETQDRFRPEAQPTPTTVTAAMVRERFGRRFRFPTRANCNLVVGGFPEIARNLVERVRVGSLKPQELERALGSMVLQAMGGDDRYGTADAPQQTERGSCSGNRARSRGSRAGSHRHPRSRGTRARATALAPRLTEGEPQRNPGETLAN